MYTFSLATKSVAIPQPFLSLEVWLNGQDTPSWEITSFLTEMVSISTMVGMLVSSSIHSTHFNLVLLKWDGI